MYGKILLFINLDFKIMSTLKTISILLFVISTISCSSKEEEYIDIITEESTNVIIINSDNEDNNDNESTSTDNDILSATLNLPFTSFNYANVNLPNYFLANGTAQEDNTPNNSQKGTEHVGVSFTKVQSQSPVGSGRLTLAQKINIHKKMEEIEAVRALSN